MLSLPAHGTLTRSASPFHASRTTGSVLNGNHNRLLGGPRLSLQYLTLRPGGRAPARPPSRRMCMHQCGPTPPGFLIPGWDCEPPTTEPTGYPLSLYASGEWGGSNHAVNRVYHCSRPSGIADGAIYGGLLQQAHSTYRLIPQLRR
jgi:hypothetical protein